jgi:hypothetical protein
MITEQAFNDSAALLNVSVASIKAVAKIEGGGQGIIDGKPVILFEPHCFFRELVKAGVKPVLSDICYERWGERPYPSGQKAQWERLERAIIINREAALKSASWGLFQILGSNYKAAGCATIQDFVNQMYKGEDNQLQLFCKYIKSVGLDEELRLKDWRLFAQGYNGKLYWKNNYDKKLQQAFESFA